MSVRWLIWFFFLGSFCSGQKNLEERIDSLVQNFGEEKPFSGMSIYIIHNDTQKMALNYGYCCSAIAENTSALHLYRIASISKSLTSYALMQMVQNGDVHLDSSIYIYGIDFPKKEWDITVRQLANHTAGIRGYQGSEFYSKQNYRSVSEAIQVFANDPLVFEPGSKYQYSSYGYNLLSHVMERAARVPFLTLMDSLVFDPLSLSYTGPESPEESKARTQNGCYVYFRNGELHYERMVDNSIKWAGGGFLATAEDIAHFGYKLHTGNVISDSLKQIFFKENIINEDSTNYALGWVVKSDINKASWIGHTGGGVGASAILATYPEDGLTISILCNTSGLNFKVLSAQIRAVLLSNED